MSVASMAQVSGYLQYSFADAYKFYNQVPNANSFNIYNWDGSLYRTVSINAPSGYTISNVYCVSKQCFNNDNNLEMCVVLTSSSVDNTRSKLWLIDENGSMIQDLGSAYMWFCYLASHNNETSMVAVSYMLDANYQTTNYSVIYSLPGSGTVSALEVNQSIIGNAFPNPTINMVTIPYQLNGKATSNINIYDAGGRLVKTVAVGSDFNEVRLDVTAFPKGVYTYECEGKSDRFIVQ